MGAVDLVLVQDAELERIRWQRQRGVPQGSRAHDDPILVLHLPVEPAIGLAEAGIGRRLLQVRLILGIEDDSRRELLHMGLQLHAEPALDVALE